jgi:hypothetical protein
MAWTTPGTAVAGDVLTAARWNTDVRDNTNELKTIADDSMGLIILPTSVVNATLTNAQITFSAASSININGCFTSSYDNYKISILFNGSADSSLQLRMRLSGTDNSAATYGGYCQVLSLGGGGLITEWSQAANNTSMRICEHSPGKCYTNFDLMAPNIAQPTFAANGAQYDSSNTGAGFWYGAHTTATAFDGFTIFPASGTITGTMRIYGYRNS